MDGPQGNLFLEGSDDLVLKQWNASVLKENSGFKDYNDFSHLGDEDFINLWDG